MRGNLNQGVRSIIESFDFDPGTVLIKPNFNTADPFPASTDRGFLTTVTEILKSAGMSKIYIGDSSTFYKNSEKVIKRKKLADLNSRDYVKVVNFDTLERTTETIDRPKYLKKASIPNLVRDVDNIIYLPCMKTHFHAEYTGALKLSVGLLPSREKMRFHISNLQEKIAELNKLITPDLVIMDSRKCFISGGPVTGKVKEPGFLLASRDRVSVDLEAVKTIQSYENNSLKSKNPEEITQIKTAAAFGLGSLDYKLIEL